MLKDRLYTVSKALLTFLLTLSFSRGYFRDAFVACISAFAKGAALTICRNPFLEIFEAAHGRAARYQQRLLGDT